MADEGLFGRLKARGEEVFTQVSAQLMSSPQFAKAMQGAIKGKEKLDHAVGRALKQMNIPTRTEFKRALSRIETLERELAEVKSRSAPKPKPRRAAKRAAKAPPAE